MQPAQDLDHVGALLRVVRRRLALAALVGVITGLTALWIGWSTTPLFEAKATIVVERDRRAVNLAGGTDPDASTATSSIVNTHVDLLRSFQVLEDALARSDARDRAPYAGSLDPVGILSSRLRILSERESSVIELAVRDEDHDQSERVLGAVIDSYLASEVRRRSASADAGLAFLKDQVTKARTALEAARAREQVMRREREIVVVDPDTNHITAQLSSQKVERVRIASEMAASDALVAAIRTADQAPEVQSALLAMPEIRRDLLVQQALDQRNQLTERRAAMSQTYKNLHPKMLEIDSELKAAGLRLAQGVATARQGILDANRALHRQCEDMDERIRALERQVADYRETLSSLKAMAGEVSTAEKLHEQLLDRLHEETVNSRLNAPRISVGQAPAAGVAPVNIKRGMTLLAAVVTALVTAALAALTAEALDTRVRDTIRHPLIAGLRVLASLPGMPRGQEDGHLPFEESIRRLRTAILLSLPTGEQVGVIGVMTPGTGEGCSTVAAHLAAAFAAGGHDTLLVDADLAVPQGAGRVLGAPTSEDGLTDLLLGQDVAVSETAVPNLHLLHAGRPSDAPAELLHSPALVAAAQHWRQAYGVVILDLGAALAPQAGEAMDVCDHLVLVAQEAGSRKTDLRAAMDLLSRLPEGRVLGVVINDA